MSAYYSIPKDEIRTGRFELDGVIWTPERTCRNTQSDFDFMCSECGKCVDYGRIMGFKFCPKCGAKVVEAIEAWSTRASETPNRERIIELVEELSDLVGGV